MHANHIDDADRGGKKKKKGMVAMYYNCNRVKLWPEADCNVNGHL